MRRFFTLLCVLEQAIAVGSFAAGHRNHQYRVTTTALHVASVPQQLGRSCPFRAISQAFHEREAPSELTASNAIIPVDGINDSKQSQANYAEMASIGKIGLVASLGSFTQSPILFPWEVWCFDNIESSYKKALSWKCPFLRRRASDILDTADMLIRLLLVRDRTSLLGLPPSLRGVEGPLRREKSLQLTREELVEVIRKDWRQQNNKGYYVTGRLSTDIYRDDCLFDGPDPDMPVKGLRKFLNAASQLFDQRQSHAELLDLRIDGEVIVARWRFKGTLHLPWKPRMPEVIGSTTYFMDEDSLIYKHTESWDISAYQAFFWTLMPDQLSLSPMKTKAVKRHLREAFLFV